MLSWEKLKVYDRALASVAKLAQLSADWDKPPRGLALVDRVALLVQGLAGMPELD